MDDEFETVAVFADSVAANLARQRLAAVGIRSFFDGEHVTELWRLPNAVGGIKLRVAGADVDAALELLEEESEEPHWPGDESPELAAGEEGDYENSGWAESQTPLREPATSATQREVNAHRAFRGSLLGLLFPPLQLYVTWVLLNVIFANGPWTPRSRWQTIVAAILNVGTLVVVALWFSGLISS